MVRGASGPLFRDFGGHMLKMLRVFRDVTGKEQAHSEFRYSVAWNRDDDTQGVALTPCDTLSDAVNWCHREWTETLTSGHWEGGQWTR